MIPNETLVVAQAGDLAEQLRAIVREEIERAQSSRSEAEWLDERGAAKYLSLSLEGVRSATTRGKLPVHRTATGRRRYRRDELDAFACAGDDDLARSA